MAKHILVKGVVQGVGFRPFVYGLAVRFHLHGWVCNRSGGVEILVDGETTDLEGFIQSLSLESPPLAQIDSLEANDVLSDGSSVFEIRDSQDVSAAYQPLFADIAICPDCERELFNPRDRRYLYPFINCTRCGPRFTIMKEIPFDRMNTTMGEFPMCGLCHAEYADPLDRHFHAQPIACPNCGPFVELRETHSQFPTTDPRISSIEIRASAVLKARRLLREGYIVAIKGLSGFHLACDASNPYTVAELRDRKGGIDKPFAVMATNLSTVLAVCNVNWEEQRLLASAEKPIVLLARKKQIPLQSYRVSEMVAPNLDTLGVLLPYTPLHHLLLNQTDPILMREPAPPILVMTSSNFSGKPVVIDNKEALQQLSPLADAFLLHNRGIHIRSDDSVVRVHRNHIVHLRRSRGYTPYPVSLPIDSKPTLAVGGDLLNTFCLTRDRYAFLSHHIGDLGNVETQVSFEQGVHHLSHILRVEPEVVAHDLRPDTFATKYASRPGVHQIGVQHHHAHIGSCMVDNDLEDRRLIGLAFDGGGYGADGLTWGGEALIASFTGFERFAHLEYLPLPDTDSAIRALWQIAAGYAYDLGVDVEELPFLQNVDKQTLRVLRQQIDNGRTSALTSSMGRLFDAVASLIGVRNDATYEEQAAMEMEVLSKPFINSAQAYPYFIEEAEHGKLIRLHGVFQSIAKDIRANQPIGLIGAKFHKTVADISIDISRRAREATGLNEVALSGSLWQNQLLLDLVCAGLQQDGFTVYFHRQVPTNDGGLSLGQAVIANYVSAEQALRAGEHSQRAV